MSLNFDEIFGNPLKFKYLMETKEDAFEIVQKTLAEKTHIREPATLRTISTSFGYNSSWGNTFYQSYDSRDNGSTSWIDLCKDKITTPILHLSVFSETFEIESGGTIVLNIRFGGCAEPSIYGETGKFNFQDVKIGYIKLQKVVNDKGELILRNWDETNLTPGRVYTKNDIENLYSPFGCDNKFRWSSLNYKWKKIAHLTEKKSECSYIDSQKIKSLKYLNILDHTMWFSESHNYEYNMHSNNSKTFTLIFHDFLTKGDTEFDKPYAKYMKEIFYSNKDITFTHIFEDPLKFKYLMETKEDAFEMVQKILAVKTHIRLPATLKVLSFRLSYSLSSGYSTYQSYHSQSDTNPIQFFKMRNQNHLLHLSIISETFEIESNGTIVLNIRFGGCAEPSIYGATAKFNFKDVKLGFIKLQKVVNNKGKLFLRKWYETNLTPGRNYTKDHIETLYNSFGIDENDKSINDRSTLDGKWKEIARLMGIKSKSYSIDTEKIKTLKNLNILDHTMWFSESHNYEYNLFSNNCQTFSLIYHDFLTEGYSEFDKPYAKYMKDIFRKCI